MLDKAITEDARKKLRDLSIMWIDYKKAYDSVPHSWLIEILNLYKIDKHTKNFIKLLMPKWRTKIHLPHTSGCITSDFITFLRGIFQGDSLSPLLFCLALAPIRNILRRNDVGYKIVGKKVNNLLYIDDLKIYTKGRKEMERSRALIEEFSDDIKMSFGLEKCAVLHIKSGKQIYSPEVKNIPILEGDDSYKYLGVIQGNEILHEKAKKNAKKEFY